MPELDYVDDLDLLEDYDLAEGASDFSSSEEARRGRVDPDEDDMQGDTDDEAETNELNNIVIGLCSALGGYEEAVRDDGKKETVYRPGDDCLGCLRDLRKLWKHDDEDLARRVAHAYSRVNVLHNDLVPIVLTCAGTGERGDKLALAATDLITALTWPLDVLDELRDVMEKELDKSKLAGLPQLQRAQVNYKSSIMRIRGGPGGAPERDFLSTVMNFVLLPSLSKPRPNRSERDLGTVNMCLHLFRNLLSIKDPVATSLDSSELVELSTLQSKLVLAMEKSKVLDTLLMLASSASRRDYEDWNAITTDCIYHLVVGTSPKTLLSGDVEKPRPVLDGNTTEEIRTLEPTRLSDRNKSSLLSSLLTEASQKRANVVSAASSRHSRFGTTISFVASDGHRGVARQASSLRKSVEDLEAEERARTMRRKPATRILKEKGAPGYRQDWSKAARKVVIRWSDEFVKHGLESLSRTLIEDLRREREKLGDLDVARVHFMQLATFFLEYFLLRRASSPTTKLWDPNAPEDPAPSKATTDSTGEQDDDRKGKQEGERDENEEEDAQDKSPEDKEANDDVENGDGKEAEKPQPEEEAKPKATNGEDWPMSVVGFFADKWPFSLAHRRVKEAMADRNWLECGTATRLWIVMLQLIEAQELSMDEEDRNSAEWVQANVHNDNDVHETAKAITVCFKRQTFSFLDTLIHFAHAYPRSLERFMKGRESMLVKAKTRVRKQMRMDGEHDGDEDEIEKRAQDIVEDAYKERVFTFNHFQDKLSSRFLADACLHYILRWQEFSNPKDQLDTVVRVMHRIAIKGNGRRMFYQYHQRQSFKKLSSQMSVLLAVAPKPAENLKQLIKVVQRSWDKLLPEEQEKFAEGKRAPRQIKTALPAKDIMVKPGHSIEEQIGVAVGLLLEKELMSYVNWVKGALEHASSQRREIILSTDGMDALEPDEDGDFKRPSLTAMRKFEAYKLPYGEGDDKLEKDAASLPALKLLCNLVGLDQHEISEEECTWSVPTGSLPEHLDSDIATIDKYIRSPFDTNGEPYSTFVQNVRKQRERKLQEPLPSENMEGFLAPDSSSSAESSDGEFKEGARRRKKSPVTSEDEFGSSAEDSDDGVTTHQRALQKLIARKEKKKARKEKEQEKKEARAKKRTLKKKVFRPGGDDGGDEQRPRPKGIRKRRIKLAAAPMFQGLEDALDDRIEDSDEEMAEMDRAIANQRANAGDGDSQDVTNANASSSSPASQTRLRPAVLSSPVVAPSGASRGSSPPTSPVRTSPVRRSQSPASEDELESPAKSTFSRKVTPTASPVASVSPVASSSQLPSSGPDAIMSRWKAFANQSSRQEPKNLFIFSDDEDEMDELAEEGHPAVGVASSSAFRLASQSRSKLSKPKKSRARAPLVLRNQDDEEDELVDELDGGVDVNVAPVGSKARGMQGRAGLLTTAPPGIAVVPDGANKRKRVVLSEDDDD
ncbi:unnamed protein product [Tilletia laevis]|uniref:Timeless N-terminal domain-containing protein n=3 Tax=Tilletia TaxID=13289 RepID=A0A8X7SXX1_9BASI|nr:hypothetical protein CF336_g1515 [Tilletia laevis]KAE8202016.1 hypothetical protein CF328_g2457 [Tilletia controversa]KAE8264133.1 hypothetical protein A4X03_0g1165 [Tilletia caries]KAE8206543.1 hypothetical protein CF335_g1810 [Tilletia laevis]KAE8249942.1 hypothetical protein A4X06_0g2996 [Tilletia controversa]